LVSGGLFLLKVSPQVKLHSQVFSQTIIFTPDMTESAEVKTNGNRLMVLDMGPLILHRFEDNRIPLDDFGFVAASHLHDFHLLDAIAHLSGIISREEWNVFLGTYIEKMY
jgi:hypothetical protein